MAGELYLHDSYQQEMEAIVQEIVDDRFIVLDQTVFYAQGGGQPGDTGVIECRGQEYKVLNTIKKDGKILHELDREGVVEGDHVHGAINWSRRYKLMRYHTAAHILCAVVHTATGALITGNQIAEDKLRIDFSLDPYDPQQMQQYVSEANKRIATNQDVHVRFMPRDEALKLPGVVKLAGALPPNIPELRIVTIGDIDEQADGGTHVRNTKEVGMLSLVSLENKGKANRRMTVTFA
jgi:misacylated tRNA(Ala) deacylase